jgi:acetyltransferase-like isoleucine patch superfamily enzyme
VENIKIHLTSEVNESVEIGTGTQIWQYAHLRENSVVGKNVNIGRGVYIGPGVKIGDNCKIQNYALVYEPAVISSGVFIGPSTVLTNDLYPRAVNLNLTKKKDSDWVKKGVKINNGASIGANCICIGPVEIGAWALIGAGSVITKNVPDFALMAGVPAKRIGWVGESGATLKKIGIYRYKCTQTNQIYKQKRGRLFKFSQEIK